MAYNPKSLKNLENPAGRVKGSKNKFTTLKDAFVNAFKNIGGERTLTTWAKLKLNKKDFFQMLARMLPTNIKAEGEVLHKILKINRYQGKPKKK